MSQPNLAAIIPEKHARLTYEERAIPKIGPNEILVRNKAIAANPVDWKIQDYNFFITKYPNILGSDVAGIVEEVGNNVSVFKKGDRVAGFAAVIGTQNIDQGAFQTYLALPADNAVKLPDSISFEEGSILPMAVATAGAGLFLTAKIPRPSGTSKPGQGQGALVWGAASSVGILTVQIAKDLGYTVFATASPTHHEYIKSLGASYVADYRDPEVVSNIAKAAKDAGVPLSLGYDAVSTDGSHFKAAEALSQAKGSQDAKLVITLDWPEGKEVPKGVEALRTIAFQIWSEEPDLGRWLFNDYLADALVKKTVVPAPKVEVVEGGIKATQKLWDQLKAGVSGKKLIIKVD
jgi:NADPH:quinone reductase-like Zn-dependent oxidoreductase